MLGIDWTAIGTAIGAVVVAAGGYIGGRANRKVEALKDAAESDVITLMRAQMARQEIRITALEGREGRLIRHVYRLEGLMTGAGMTPPKFEIDGGTITPVGHVAPQ